jgi:uncharacterized protein DUF5063
MTSCTATCVIARPDLLHCLHRRVRLPSLSHLRAQPTVARFEGGAVAFCTFIESATTVPRGAFVWGAGPHLIALYASALDLPHVAATDSDSRSERHHISGDERFALVRRLREHLGDLDEYRLIFDPYDTKDAPVIGRLSDDLADIYRDVKDGLLALAGGDHEADVIWDWKFGFEKHWGIHALRAAYALHWITHTAGAQWVSPDD